MPILHFDHLPDLVLPLLRMHLNQCERASAAHAKLAFSYITEVTVPALGALANLSDEQAEAQAAAKGGEQS